MTLSRSQRLICILAVVGAVIIYMIFLLRTYEKAVDRAQTQISLDAFHQRKKLERSRLKVNNQLDVINKGTQNLISTGELEINKERGHPQAGVNGHPDPRGAHVEGGMNGQSLEPAGSIINHPQSNQVLNKEDHTHQEGRSQGVQNSRSSTVSSTSVDARERLHFLETIITSGNASVWHGENVDTGGSGVYKALWVKGRAEHLLTRVAHYNAALHNLRRSLVEKRGETPWVELDSGAETLWCNRDDFHRELERFPFVQTLALEWNQPHGGGGGGAAAAAAATAAAAAVGQSKAAAKGGGATTKWNPRRDTANLLLQHYPPWSGSELLCSWIRRAGYTRARWDAVYNRTCDILEEDKQEEGGKTAQGTDSIYQRKNSGGVSSKQNGRGRTYLGGGRRSVSNPGIGGVPSRESVDGGHKRGIRETTMGLDPVYLHGKPINKQHYWPHHGTQYPDYFYTSPPPQVFYIHIMEDAVVTSLGDVLTHNLKLVPYSCSQDIAPSPPRDYHFAPVVDDVFIMGQYWGGSFFHLMIENLPRLAPYVDFLKANPEIRIHAQATDGRTAASVELLGIEHGRLVKGTLRAKRVFLPQATPCGFAHLQSIQILAHLYAQHLQTQEEGNSQGDTRGFSQMPALKDKKDTIHRGTYSRRVHAPVSRDERQILHRKVPQVVSEVPHVKDERHTINTKTYQELAESPAVGDERETINTKTYQGTAEVRAMRDERQTISEKTHQSFTGLVAERDKRQTINAKTYQGVAEGPGVRDERETIKTKTHQHVADMPSLVDDNQGVNTVSRVQRHLLQAYSVPAKPGTVAQVALPSQPVAGTITRKGRPTVLLIKRSGSRHFTQHGNIRRVLEEIAAEFSLDFQLFADNPPPTLSESMVMFRRARLVVGPHGAGLSNIVYSRPGTLVIEGVCNPPHVNMCYQWTAHVLGLRYHGIASRGGCETWVDVDYHEVASAARDLLKHSRQ